MWTGRKAHREAPVEGAPQAPPRPEVEAEFEGHGYQPSPHRRRFRFLAERTALLPSEAAPRLGSASLAVRIDAPLADWLQRAAQARRLAPQALAAELLEQALRQEALRDELEAALAGLTPRQREVTQLTAAGCTNHEIAQKLVISLETVKTHMRHILERLGVASKADLRALLALHAPEMPPPDRAGRAPTPG